MNAPTGNPWRWWPIGVFSRAVSACRVLGEVLGRCWSWPAPRSRGPADAGAERQLTDHEETSIRVIRRATRLGIRVWPAFTLLDAYMCFVLYPGAPFGLFLLYRLVVEAFLLAVHHGTLRADTHPARLARALDLGFLLAAGCVSLMAVHLGGVRSAYMHGISIVFLVRAAVVPGPWRESLKVFAPLVLVFPVTMLLAAALSPALRALWFEDRTLALAASHYVFVLASSVVGMVSGHVVWAAQQQVYRARRMGRYRLQAPLGKGGMGEVWLAWDPSLRRNIALKLLRPGGRADADAIRRFEREAYATSQLRVPHTIQIYDFGASDDGIYYIAMEYLPGTDLHSLVREHGPLPPARAVRFALHACLSLEEAHDNGIIHRDIKPQNLFVTRVGGDADFLKVLDFGLARVRAADPEVQLTRAGFLIGTPAYLAPELWEGGVADVRSDIYALGATLHFLLTGTEPFPCKEIAGLIGAHLSRTPPSPSAVLGTPVPARLEEIIARCLAKEPQERFPSIRDLHAALKTVEGEGSRSTYTPWVAGVELPGAS